MNETERNLNKNFPDDCDWLVDKKLSIHFGEVETKCVLFKMHTKHRDLIKVVVLLLNMVRYTLSNITRWHVLVAHWIKLFLKSQWLLKL